MKNSERFIADKGYDSETIREKARKHQMNPVIPRKSINSSQKELEFLIKGLI